MCRAALHAAGSRPARGHLSRDASATSPWPCSTLRRACHGRPGGRRAARDDGDDRGRRPHDGHQRARSGAQHAEWLDVVEAVATAIAVGVAPGDQRQCPSGNRRGCPSPADRVVAFARRNRRRRRHGGPVDRGGRGRRRRRQPEPRRSRASARRRRPGNVAERWRGRRPRRDRRYRDRRTMSREQQRRWSTPGPARRWYPPVATESRVGHSTSTCSCPCHALR